MAAYDGAGLTSLCDEHGLLTARRALESGVTDRCLQRLTRGGLLVHLFRGVYLLGSRRVLTAEGFHAQLMRGARLLEDVRQSNEQLQSALETLRETQNQLVQAKRLAAVGRLAASVGCEGRGIACWGDHMDVSRAASDPAYVADRKAILARYGLQCWALGNHLAGQCVGDRYDPRLDGFAPDDVKGDPKAIRKWAIKEMKLTARAAQADQ